MSTDKANPEFLLLDWHLNRLTADEKSWVEAVLASDPALRAKSDKLQHVLEPLDSWQIPTPSANLADKVLSHIRKSKGQWDTARPWPSVPALAEGSGRTRPFFRGRELVAVAACLLVMVGIMVPGVSEMRSRSRQTACASNLGSIFRGVSAYQEQFDGALPFAGHVAGAAWMPQGDSDRPYLSNSRHPFLLAKHGLISRLDDFLCPSAAEARVMKAADVPQRGDFVEAANLSYDTLNVSGDDPMLKPTKTTAYMSDRNPLFVNGRFNGDVDPDRTNSPAHGGRGQTVLTLDGAVNFADSPIYGEAKDNLWLVNNVRRYTGTETSRERNDAFLVPGFPKRAASN